MTGKYVEIVKVSEGGHIYLSNGDKIAKTPNDVLYVEYRETDFAERLLKDGKGCKTLTEAIESYQDRTKNCLVGPMDAEGVERILSSPGLSWVTDRRVLPSFKKEA